MKLPAFVANAAGAARSAGGMAAGVAAKLAARLKDSGPRLAAALSGLISKAKAGKRRSKVLQGVADGDGLRGEAPDGSETFSEGGVGAGLGTGSSGAGWPSGAANRGRILLAAAILAVALGLCLTLILALSGAGRRGRAETGTAMTGDGRAGQVEGSEYAPWPPSGPGLASAMLIPGRGEWPWPLAFEPKSRYTGAEAAALRPDLGEIDTAELTRRRKAALEAMYGSVD